MTLLPASAPPDRPRGPVTASRRTVDLLTAVCPDAWLLASHGAAGDGSPEGRAWERAVAELLVQPGISRRQGPGGTTLLGMPSASGCRHELDGVANSWPGTLTRPAYAQLSPTDNFVSDPRGQFRAGSHSGVTNELQDYPSLGRQLLTIM